MLQNQRLFHQKSLNWRPIVLFIHFNNSNSEQHMFYLSFHLWLMKCWMKYGIKIISSLNASPKLLLSEMLKLVKLILTVSSTNFVIERLRSCFILATDKKKVDKLKLAEVASQLFSKKEHHFPFKNRYFLRKFT